MKQKILINFHTNNTGGILNFKKNSLIEFDKFFPDQIVYALVGDHKDYFTKDKKLKNIIIIDDLLVPKNLIKKILFYEIYLNKLIIKKKIDIVLNFGNIPIKSKITQIFYFQWPYAVFDNYEIWSRIKLKSKLPLLLKKLYFFLTLNRVTNFIVQTKTMKDLLSKKTNKNIIIAKVGYNKAEVDLKFKTNQYDSQNRNFIYPTIYYDHKNIEILVDVAKLLKSKKINVKFVLTMNKYGQNEEKIINDISRFQLNDYFTITGYLPRDIYLKKIYESYAIIMPTLMETYGYPYNEAITYNKLILTSDRNFSREICEDTAIYFNPLNPSDICEKIIYSLNNRKIIEKKIDNQKKLMENFISWEQCCKIISEIVIQKLN